MSRNSGRQGYAPPSGTKTPVSSHVRTDSDSPDEQMDSGQLSGNTTVEKSVSSQMNDKEIE